MLRRILIMVIAGVLSVTLFGFRPANVLASEGTQSVEKVRAKIAELRLGKETKVKVRLRDKTRLEGYIGQMAEDSFSIVDAGTGNSRTVLYSDVEQVSRRGNGLSTMTKVMIGAAAAAGVIAAFVILKPAVCDGGAQTGGIC